MRAQRTTDEVPSRNHRGVRGATGVTGVIGQMIGDLEKSHVTSHPKNPEHRQVTRLRNMMIGFLG